MLEAAQPPHAEASHDRARARVRGVVDPDDALTLVASGYTLAFDRFDPAGDLGMVAPRMLGPEVRRCYEEGVGFITAVGVHRDVTGHAHERPWLP